MSFLESIKENVFLADGATGTFLQSRGLEPGGCPELMNIENEDVFVYGLIRTRQTLMSSLSNRQC